MSVPAKIAAALLGIGMAALSTAPAMAAETDRPAGSGAESNFGNAINAANSGDFSAAAVCLQEVAVVPVLGDWVGDHANNCSNGNVIDHSGR